MKTSEVIAMFEKSDQLIRHGDVVLVKTDVSGMPEGKDRQGIVAFGEATGHAHRVLNASVKEFGDGGGDMTIINANGDSKIIHEEHKDVNMDGSYIGGIQKQYSPSGWSRVVD